MGCAHTAPPTTTVGARGKDEDGDGVPIGLQSRRVPQRHGTSLAREGSYGDIGGGRAVARRAD